MREIIALILLEVIEKGGDEFGKENNREIL